MQTVQNTQVLSTFFTDVRNYAHDANKFLDRGLFEILEKDLGFQNMAFTHYDDGRFVSATSYVTNVPNSQVMLMIREYYRIGYFRNDRLAHYVTDLLKSLPAYTDCGPVQAKKALNEREFEEYAAFFAPYEIQDAVVLPLDKDSRLTVFHKKSLPKLTEDDLFVLDYVQKVLQMSYEYWKEWTRSKTLSHMKDHIIEEHNVGIALFDEDMELVECNAMFLKAVSEIYRTSDIRKGVANLLVAVVRGETELNQYRVRFEKAELGSASEHRRGFSSIQIEETKQNPSFSVSSGKKKTDKAEFNNPIARLTNREIEIMTRYCEGKTTHEIADALFISEWTVKAHIKNIYKKLNVTNQRQLISEYMKMQR